MMDEPIKNGENGLRDEKGRFVDGHRNLSPGRTPGKLSITVEQEKYYKEHPEEFADFLRRMRMKEDFWRKFWDKVDPNPPTGLNIGGSLELPIRIIEVIKPDDPDNKPV